MRFVPDKNIYILLCCRMLYKLVLPVSFNVYYLGSKRLYLKKSFRINFRLYF